MSKVAVPGWIGCTENRLDAAARDRNSNAPIRGLRFDKRKQVDRGVPPATTRVIRCRKILRYLVSLVNIGDMLLLRAAKTLGDRRSATQGYLDVTADSVINEALK